MVNQYRNGFYRPNMDRREFYNRDSKFKIHRGYEIHKVYNEMFHIVKDDVCVGMYAGPNGARNAIDDMIDKTGIYHISNYTVKE